MGRLQNPQCLDMKDSLEPSAEREKLGTLLVLEISPSRLLSTTLEAGYLDTHIGVCCVPFFVFPATLAGVCT